ncbi:MAG TPA: hypothetical protein GXZ26_06225 [Firmicutes bacterium]|jgi:hypothetical protein|nr:hypothetical protein [Bacillota bacterium]
MKRTFYLFILFSLSIFLLGCRSNGGGKGGGVDKEWSKFYRLDLDGAKAVVEWPTTVNGNIVGKLFKITNDNKFVAVDPLDSQGDKVNINFMPMSLCNAGPDYLMAWVSNDRGGDAPGAYLIHTRDGRVYQVPPEAGYPADYLRGSNRNRGYTVQFDRAGNLYYLNRKPHGKEEVVKLTIGSGVTAKIISYKYDTDIRLFWVDSDGNVMYNFTHQNSFRLINSDGVPLRTFANNYKDNKHAANCFLADGELYIIGWPDQAERWVIDKITVGPGDKVTDKVTLTEYGSGPDPERMFTTDCKSTKNHEVNLQGHVFYVNIGSGRFFEIYNPSGSQVIPHYFKFNDHFLEVYDHDHTDNEIYFIGIDITDPDKRRIVRFHPAADTMDIYQVSSDYHITGPPSLEKSLIALGNGELLLEGIRKSDDRRVLLLVDSSGFHEIAEMDPKYGDMGICFERVPFHVD